MAPIRVALCITDLDVGGAERCLQHLAVGADRERFEPIVYCLGPRPQNPSASCVEPIEAAGIPVHCLGANRAWHFPRTARQLRKLLATQSPQITQTFLFHANFIGRLAARRARVPHILSGIRVAERHSKWHLWLDRSTQRLVERHVCVSASVAEFSALHGGLAKERLVVIPNGIDTDAVAAAKPVDLAEFGIQAGRRAITFIGRLEPQKGLPWLLDTAVQWLPRVPDHDLLLVGSGQQGPELQRQAQRLGIADRLRLAGWRPDVLEIVAASDLLVLPSRWEGMPNVVLQAMAQGKPVLATEVEGTCELLGDLAEPQTAAYGETQVFSDKLVATLSAPAEAERLGAENRQRARQEFSLSQMIRAYEDLWESLARS
jgi:glycosyltransferase involved in cell wall biosynthesis